MIVFVLFLSFLAGMCFVLLIGYKDQMQGYKNMNEIHWDFDMNILHIINNKDLSSDEKIIKIEKMFDEARF